MKKFLVVASIAAAVFLLAAGYLFVQSRLGIVGTAWVNMYARCPDSPDYGELIDPTAPMWRDFNQSRLSQNVPHGTAVSLLTDSPNQRDTYRVRLGYAEGYIPAQYLSDYDPANGVQPDDSTCLE